MCAFLVLTRNGVYWIAEVVKKEGIKHYRRGPYSRMYYVLKNAVDHTGKFRTEIKIRKKHVKEITIVEN